MMPRKLRRMMGVRVVVQQLRIRRRDKGGRGRMAAHGGLLL
jgi:hypothetical protein